MKMFMLAFDAFLICFVTLMIYTIPDDPESRRGLPFVVGLGLVLLLNAAFIGATP